MPDSRFHDGRQAVTHVVRVFTFGRELRIVGPDDATLAVWMPSEMRAAPEVDPDGVVTLTARGRLGELLVDDPGQLQLIRAAGVRLPGRKAWSHGSWITVCAGLVVTLALGLLAVNTVPAWLATAIPFSWERRLGAPTEALMTTASGRCSGQEGQAALDRLVSRLLTTGHVAMPVKIAVLDTRTVNAFTLPGGHVLVMRGLITHADDGAELAGVIAHELGHVAHRDSTTLLLRQMGLSMLAQMIGLGDGSGLAASGATNLMTLAYTRAAEAAADDTAITLLTAAGMRADGLSRFFAHLEDGGGGATVQGTGMNWLETHPPSVERRDHTARPATGEEPFTEAEWAAIRAMCGDK